MEERVKALEDALAAANAAADAARVAAVSVKLPPFWPDKAQLWFAQAEAQFTIRNITASKTKYAHAMTMLDSKSAELAMDIIVAPPDDAYEALKTRLTGAYAITDDEKAARLLDMTGLGDQTPSQCMSGMLRLVPTGQDPGFLFRKIFLRQLPLEVQNHLVQTSKTGVKAEDLRELALEADRYFSSMGSRIAAVSQTSVVAEEDYDVNAVSGRKVCFYHAKWGEKATKCRQPCHFKTPRSSATPNQGNFKSGRGQSS